MEMLISSVQERPALWDKRNNYHNRLIAFREWEEVAKLIGTTIDGAKKKWKNLRDTYARELKKIPKARSGADADNEPEYTGSWPYFESLEFLKVILKPRCTEGNIQPDIEEYSINFTDSPGQTDDILADENISEELYVVDDPELHVYEYEQFESSASPDIIKKRKIDTSSESSTPTATKRKKPKHDDNLKEFLGLEREKLEVLRQETKENNDDDLLWFKSILPYMKKLPALNKLNFRTTMQESLFTELTMLNKN